MSKVQRERKPNRIRWWAKAVACLIVFSVVYALVLPAITIDKDHADREPGIELSGIKAVTVEAKENEDGGVFKAVREGDRARSDHADLRARLLGRPDPSFDRDQQQSARRGAEKRLFA